jgi:hypothetical protein
LAGRGSPVEFAKEFNTDRRFVGAIARGQISRGRPKRSYRIERAIDEFIAEQFEKHKDILNLGGLDESRSEDRNNRRTARNAGVHGGGAEK